ncbi:MAG: RDD family protein [Gluconacetobacter diazotrophicus]|nr:RDD family protein [Gluconacetobacter diazotrophicus]
MNILVAKNGSQLGPFPENDIRAKLASGELLPSDYGWYEGLAAWTPLSQLVGAAVAPQPQPPQPYSAPAAQNAPGSYAPQPYNSPYPQAYQPGAPSAWGMPTAVYGGFWLRFVAHLIDTIILVIPFVVMMFGVGIVIGLTASDHPSPNDVNPIINLVVVIALIFFFVAVWFYFAGMESSARQATFGKRAVGLRVTDLHGNRISLGQATGRFFGKYLSSIFLIGYLMAAFTPRKQALHDMLASTLVVQG